MKPPSMRSFCRRNIMTTSTSLSPSAHVLKDLDSQSRLHAGGHQGGWADQADAVLHLAQQHDVRARDARMRDIAADRDQTGGATRPLARRIVSASSRACVGCSCRPSPAFNTAPLTFCASRSTAPECGCRTTRRSGCIAFNVKRGVNQRFALFER